MTAPPVQIAPLTFRRDIAAPMDHLWAMLSNRDDLCDWLCYDALVRFNADDGFATFIWNDGPHAYGTYDDIVEHERIQLTWHDGISAPTTVTVKVSANDGAPLTLHLRHEGFADVERAAHYETFWQEHLHELKMQLETGERPRITDRVMMGVLIDNSTEAQAEAGLHVLRAIEGYSAADAGIVAGDVITHAEGQPLEDISSLPAIVADKRPGDTIEVQVQHDDTTHTMVITLKGYLLPDIPTTFAEMAQQHRDEYVTVNDALAAALQGVTREVMQFKPADDEWSIHEILAHMILTQRHTLEWLSSYANGPRRINSYYQEAERIAALVATYSTVEALVDELHAVQTETIAMIEQFDTAMEARKGYLWWMTYEIIWTEDNALRLIETIAERKTQFAAE